MDLSRLYKNKDQTYYNHTRTELIDFLPRNVGKVLDIGCGTGNFGKMLKDLKSCLVWGIEPDIRSFKEAEKKLDYVINSVLTEDVAATLNNKFDCIFFNDVLEHLPQPEEALLLAASMLNDGGHIVASIPNIRFYPVILSLLRNKDFEYKNDGVLDKTHLRFFTKRSMKRLFHENGFEIIKMDGINACNDFRIFNILNFILLNTQEDMKYPQFAILCKLKK